MTKSRMALPILCAGAAAWPGAASAQSRPATAEEAIAAYERWFDEATAAGGTRRCRRDAAGDEIVVCGRGEVAGMRVPYEPVAGQVHRIAGDLPTGSDAMAADHCLRLCYQPVMLNVGEAVRFLGRGLDRILHPD